MRLKAKQVPYSSVVGGGLTLIDENGRPAFMLMLAGTSNGISKEQNAAMSEQLARLINVDGLEVPDV